MEYMFTMKTVPAVNIAEERITVQVVHTVPTKSIGTDMVATGAYGAAGHKQAQAVHIVLQRYMKDNR